MYESATLPPAKMVAVVPGSVVPVFNSSSVNDSVVGLSSLLLTVNSTISQKHIRKTCFRTSWLAYSLFQHNFLAFAITEEEKRCLLGSGEEETEG